MTIVRLRGLFFACLPRAEDRQRRHGISQQAATRGKFMRLFFLNPEDVRKSAGMAVLFLT
jgi:hypothetical protein